MNSSHYAFSAGDHAADAFWSRIDRTDEAGCWIWTGATCNGGYGKLTFKGKQKRAHRLAMELTFGKELSKELYVCHTCDNRLCCNPTHLYCGTPQQNAFDRELRGRGQRVAGEDHPNARLSEAAVILIKQALCLRVSQSQLAKAFGVAKETISAIATGKTWKSVPWPCERQ